MFTGLSSSKDSKGAKAIMRNHLNHARDIYFDLMGEEEN